jgi:c(7)-type cytochrome triheme protein
VRDRLKGLRRCLALTVLLPALALSACSDGNSDKTAAEREKPAKSEAAKAAANGPGWMHLAETGLFDPANPDLKALLNPADALSVLPRRGNWGNKVNWMQSLEEGLIEPRSTLRAVGKLPRSDIVVLLNVKGGQPVARFPHKQHTAWLDCGTCHRGLFASVAGDTPLTMLGILEGRHCGQCHGAVAFPVADCKRCHAVKHEEAFRWVKSGRCEQRQGKDRLVIVCPE